MQKEYCQYYHVGVCKEKTWFIVGCFRNEDHVVFERTLASNHEILEFFVPDGQEAFFLDMMGYMQRKGLVYWIEKKPNRMQQEDLGLQV